MAEEDNNIIPQGVFVSNISPTADQKTVNDFFSFCGKIESLSLQKTSEGDGELESVVMFESESAAKTALLLTNAMIVDRSIKVEQLNKDHAKPPSEAQMDAGAIEQKPFDVKDEERSKTSVVASLLAAGYSVGADTLTKAKTYDDEHMITLSLQQGAEKIKARALEIDEQYKISENLTAAKNKVSSTVSAVDESYGISKAINAGYQTAKGAAVAAGSVVAAKAMENETVASGVQKVQSTTSAATSAVNEKLQDLQSTTKAEIDKREAAKVDEKKDEEKEVFTGEGDDIKEVPEDPVIKEELASAPSAPNDEPVEKEPKTE